MKSSKSLYPKANSLTQAILHKIWSNKVMKYNYLPLTLAFALPLISGIQLLALNFESLYLNLASNPKNFDHAIQFLASIILTRKEFVLHSLDALSIIILVLTCLYMALLLIYIGVISIFSMKNLNIPKLISGSLINFGYFHLFVFALPVHSILLEILRSTVQDLNQASSKVILILVVAVLDLINIAFSVVPIKLAVLIQTKDPLSRTNNQYLLSTTLQKFIIATLNWLSKLGVSQTHLSAFILALNFVLGIISLYVLVRTVPFYKFKLNKKLIKLESWIFSITTISLLDLIFSGTRSMSKGYVLFIVFLLAATFITKIILNYPKYKRLNLDHRITSSKFSSSETFWIIHQVRYLKKLFSRSLQPDLALKKWTSKQLLEAGRVYDISALLNLPCSFDSKFPTKESRRDLIIQLLYRISEVNPKNSNIKLLLAGYLIKRSEKIYEPAALISQVLKTSKHDLTTHLSALLLQEEIKVILETNLEQRRSEIDLVSYFTSHKQYDKLKNMIEKQLHLMEDFHKILSDTHAQALELLKVSTKIQETQVRIHKFWESLPTDFLEKKASFFLTYALYNTYINYDQQKGNEYLHQYKILVRRNIASFKYNSIDDKTLYDPNNLGFYISGEPGTIGTIVDCSANVRNTLGFQKEELVGKNANILIPNYFHQNHKQLMLSRLQNNQQLFDITHINSFVKDSHGYIIPMKNMIILYPSLDHGFLFCSIIRIFNTKFEYILVSENGTIEGFTQGLGQELGLSNQAKPELSEISPILAKVERAIQKLVKEEGKSFQKLSSKCTSEPEPYAKKSVVFDFGNHLGSDNMKSDSRAGSRPNDEHLELATKTMEKGHRFTFKKLKGSKVILDKREQVDYYCKAVIRNYLGRALKVLLLRKTSSEVQESNTKTSFSDASYYFGEMPELLGQTKNDKVLQLSPQDAPDHVSTYEDNFPSENERNADSPRHEDKLLMLKSLEFHKFSTAVEIPNPKEVTIELKTPTLKIVKQKKRISVSELDDEEEREDPIFDKTSSVCSEDKKKERKLSLLLEVLGFYKFREAKLPFLCMTVFTIIFLIATWLVYDGAVQSIPQIQGAVDVFRTLLDRTNAFYLIMRETYIIYLVKLFIPTYAYPATTLVQLLQEAKDTNSELKELLKYLEEDTQKLFFEKNVKVFYDILPDINTTTSYMLQDSISSAYSIVEEGLYVAKHITSTLAEKKYKFAMEFLFNNMYNDMLIKNGELISKIYKDINHKVGNVSKNANILSTITGAVFGLSVLILGLMLCRIYNRSKFFLNCLVDGGQDEEIHKLKSTVAQFRSLLNTDMSAAYDLDQGSTIYSFTKAEKVKNTQHIIKHKHLKTRGFFLVFAKRFLLITLLSLVSLLILVNANKIFENRTSSTLPAINDITQAGEMSFAAQLAISEMLIYIIKPNSPIKYHDSSYIFESDIEALSNVLSSEETNFSQEFQLKLTQNFCPYVNKTLFKTCSTTGNSIATQGVLGTIYHTQQGLRQFKTFYDTIPAGPLKMSSAFSNPTISELYSLVYYGVAPALVLYSDERASDLSAILDNGAHIIVKYSVSGVILSILTLLGSWFVIYPKILKERKILCRTILLIPPYLVIKNKLLKEFLLKESKLFHNYVRNYQENRYEYLLNISAIKSKKFVKANA